MRHSASFNWGAIGLGGSAVLVAVAAGPLAALFREAGAISARPLFESLTLPLLVAGCVYLIVSHAHAGFLAPYPQAIRTKRGFAIATFNDMAHQVVVLAWLAFLGVEAPVVRAIVIGGAAVHAAYLVLLATVPRWFLYEASNLHAATLREDDGPAARPRWQRRIYGPGRFIAVWIDCAAHVVGLSALVAVAANHHLLVPAAVGLALGAGVLRSVYGPQAAMPRAVEV